MVELEVISEGPDLGNGIRRILERRIRIWKAQHGPEQEVMFRQAHEPGGPDYPISLDVSGLGIVVDGASLHLVPKIALPTRTCVAPN